MPLTPKIVRDDRLSYSAKGAYFVIKYLSDEISGVDLFETLLDKSTDNLNKIEESLEELFACGYIKVNLNHEKRQREWIFC